MNPADAFRKSLRKKELKRNKKERKKVRDVRILKKDPESLREQIAKLETTNSEGALDKARKHKKRQLEDTLNLVLKKRKEYEEKFEEMDETPAMLSHLGRPRSRATAEEEEERIKYPKPEDSVYYHPTLNPTGAPLPGKPPRFTSSAGTRISLSAASSSGAASSTLSDPEDAGLCLSTPPPPLPLTGDMDSGGGSIGPASLPLPPPPPMPPTLLMMDVVSSLPPPPLQPPPPPRSPPRESISACPLFPSSPPIKQQPSLTGPAMVPSLEPHVLPLGISRFPRPSPPTDMRLPLVGSGIAGQPTPSGVMLPPIINPFLHHLRPVRILSHKMDGLNSGQPATQPSYVKSAASTVVKRPLAKHTPELTSMVPASVRVRRETALLKAKPKTSTVTVVNRPAARAAPNVDDSYMAFLQDMKALGALDG